MGTRTKISSPLLLAALAAGVSVVAWPSPAWAAACCVSATSFGVGRLTIWEDAAFGVRVQHARILGQWDPSGILDANPPGYFEGLTTIEPWAIVRLSDRIALAGHTPFLINDRWSTTTSQLAGGVGDVGVGARFELISIGEYEGLPSLAINVGAVAPTGRRTEQTSPPLFAGTTGLGAWQGSVAIESELAPMPWFVRLEAGVTGFLPFRRSDTLQIEQYAPAVQIALSSGRELVADKIVAAAAISFDWQDRIALSGVATPNSWAYEFGLGLSLSVRTDRHWTFVFGANNTMWPAHFAANRDARIGLSIGARYGYF